MELTITNIIENAAELERDAQQDSQLQAATHGLADILADLGLED